MPDDADAKLMTVARFSTILEAQFAQSRLEEHEIPSAIFGNEDISAYSDVVPPPASIHLQVPEPHAEALSPFLRRPSNALHRSTALLGIPPNRASHAKLPSQRTPPSVPAAVGRTPPPRTIPSDLMTMQRWRSNARHISTGSLRTSIPRVLATLPTLSKQTGAKIPTGAAPLLPLMTGITRKKTKGSSNHFDTGCDSGSPVIFLSQCSSGLCG